jgi:peptidoglycan/LPS O-acetylase OafA/YrhL
MSHIQKKHFTGLNTLRFFAAYFVIFHHGETIRAKNGLAHFENYSFFRNGSLAVSFFFVLSGFLITYLLLTEIKNTQTISLKKFYMRRVLRIFPLYYLLVFIGLIAIPILLKLINYTYQMPYDTATAGVLFGFFLSFVVNPLYGSHLLEPLWSIGVEEYFYLIWAPLFKISSYEFIRNNKTLRINSQLLVIIGMMLLKAGILLFYHFYNVENETLVLIKEVLLNLKFELMAIGGLGAYFIVGDNFPRVFNSWKVISLERVWFFKPVFQVFFLCLLFIRLFFHNYFTENAHTLYTILFQTPVLSVFTEGGLFLWLILNVSVNPKAVFKLKNPILEKLGEISYGIYMYQMLVIFATVLVFKKTMLEMSPLVQTVFFYAVVSVGVLGISWLSKRYFEDYFLTFKNRY